MLFFQPNLLIKKGRKMSGNNFEAIESAIAIAEKVKFLFEESIFKTNQIANKKKKIIVPSKCKLPVISIIIKGFKA